MDGKLERTAFIEIEIFCDIQVIFEQFQVSLLNKTVWTEYFIQLICCGCSVILVEIHMNEFVEACNYVTQDIWQRYNVHTPTRVYGCLRMCGCSVIRETHVFFQPIIVTAVRLLLTDRSLDQSGYR